MTVKELIDTLQQLPPEYDVKGCGLYEMDMGAVAEIYDIYVRDDADIVILELDDIT
jgi:hypothetical protein